MVKLFTVLEMRLEKVLGARGKSMATLSLGLAFGATTWRLPHPIIKRHPMTSSRLKLWVNKGSLLEQKFSSSRTTPLPKLYFI